MIIKTTEIKIFDFLFLEHYKIDMTKLWNCYLFKWRKDLDHNKTT